MEQTRSMDSQGPVVAVVGASGAVGREMVSILEERQFMLSSLKLLASERSVGVEIPFRGRHLAVEQLREDSLSGVDIALFSAGSKVSETFAPAACEKGTVVIDNSSRFRMVDGVPLIVPEVNGDELRGYLREHDEGLLVANPNCSTIQLVVVLAPLRAHAGLERVVVSTYQSVSGAGQKGIDELQDQTLALFQQREVAPAAFPHEIAFNCLPHIDAFEPNGYTREEMKIVRETRKILDFPELRITATAVRVPVFACHGESVNLELSSACTAEEARDILKDSPGVVVIDDPEQGDYPLGRDLVGSDATYVGRIRKDSSLPSGIDLWIVADNLRKGAALNAVEIAEIVSDCR